MFTDLHIITRCSKSREKAKMNIYNYMLYLQGAVGFIEKINFELHNVLFLQHSLDNLSLFKNANLCNTPPDMV